MKPPELRTVMLTFFSSLAFWSAVHVAVAVVTVQHKIPVDQVCFAHDTKRVPSLTSYIPHPKPA